MKIRILFIALLLIAGIGSAFAKSPSEVNATILNNFRKEFVTAKETNWEITRNYSKVTFVMNNQVLFAYYNESGERLALIRNISVNQLPLVLFNSVKSEYKDFWVSDCFELSNDVETAYFTTVENADVKITLKSSGTLGWVVYKKQQKN